MLSHARKDAGCPFGNLHACNMHQQSTLNRTGLDQSLFEMKSLPALVVNTCIAVRCHATSTHMLIIPPGQAQVC